MDSTNYHEYMKKLELLRRQKDELIHRKAQKVLKERVQLLQSLKNSLNNDVGEIKRISDGVNANSEQLSSVLARKSQEFVHMDKSCVQNVKNIVESMQEIFESARETSKAELSGYDGKMQEFGKVATKLNYGYRKFHNNCFTLFNNVHYLKSRLNEDNTLNDSKRRLRTSVLSDSSLLNTFHSNNLSASSPIPSIKGRRASDSDKEN